MFLLLRERRVVNADYLYQTEAPTDQIYPLKTQRKGNNQLS